MAPTEGITMRNYHAQINTWLQAAVDDWFRRQIANPYQPMQLFFKPANGAQDGGLYIGYQPLNNEWRRAGVQVTGFMDKRKAYAVCREQVNTLPILGDYD
jgi:hypothetical protein